MQKTMCEKIQDGFYSRHVIFTFFKVLQQRPLNVNLGILYNVWWGLSCGSYYYLDRKQHK